MRTRPTVSRLADLSKAARRVQRPAWRVVAEWAALWARQRLSVEEYQGLQLFDDRYYGAADKTRFVGAGGSRRILLSANYRLDLYGLIDNKIACDFLLAAHGLPVMPTIALYREGARSDAPFLLRDRAALRTFLSDVQRYPLFGKPLAGKQSLGSASLERYDAASGQITAFGGRALSLDAFIAEVTAHYPAGYLFQKRLAPPPSVRAVCGDRLASVRVLTAMRRNGPEILRAAWKIPAGPNAADNFWRVGNLLAQLDLAGGTVKGAVQTTRSDFVEVHQHPDSGIVLAGLSVPQWEDILALARDGARVLEDLGLLGWDIAPTESGAIIIEVNQIPDLRLHQIADRRGILDRAMADFLRERQAHKAAWRQRQIAG